MHDTLAVIQCHRQQTAQFRLVFRLYDDVTNRQLNGVLLKAVQAWKTIGRQELAIDAQEGIATRFGPVSQLGINAFSPNH